MDELNSQNANRDIFNFSNVQGDIVVVNQSKKSPRTDTEKYLISIVKSEIASRLEHSLNNKIIINLDKENQPNQVFRFWDNEIKTGTKSSKIFPSKTSIVDIFDRDDIAGNLLILGPPGCGKTVAILELAKALTKRVEQHNDYPIPVLFNLASWNDDNQSIISWLVLELKLKYGVRLDVGRKLLEKHKLLPLLDGLDELKPTRQEICTLAINEFLSSEYRPTFIVIGSRQEEYELFDTKLLLRSSISLKPLTYLQIRDYLTSVQREDLWKSIRLYDDLLNLLSIPLFLNIAVLAEEELLVDEWRRVAIKNDRINFLLSAYIRRMFTRKIKKCSYKGKHPNIKQTNIWLIWLSRNLQRESKTDFLIEDLQPNSLEIKKREQYTYYYKTLGRGAYTIPGVVIFLLGCSIGINAFQGVFGLLLGIIFGIISFKIQREQWIQFYSKDFELVNFRYAENRTWSWEQAKVSVFDDKAQLIGKVLGLITLSIVWSYRGELFIAFTTPILLSLLHCYFGGISQGQEIAVRNTPNQGIIDEYRGFRNRYLWLHSIFWVLFTLISYFFIPGIVVFKVIVSVLLGFLTGGVIAFLSLIPIFFIWVLFGGGKPCTQHFFLRYTLFKNGDIPWNYAQFLDYATERLFLQRIGGRYRFIHRMLQDYFSMAVDVEEQ